MEKYTESDWENEIKIGSICKSCKDIFLKNNTHVLGVCNIPCPECGNIGFYSPRSGGERKYRACKFCGFWQDVDERPGHCRIMICDNHTGPFAKINWQYQGNQGKDCDGCGKKCREQKNGERQWYKENCEKIIREIAKVHNYRIKHRE